MKSMPALDPEDDGVHGAASHADLRADEARWNALALVGIQDCYELREPGDVIELRNCTCGSTLGRRTRRS
jgi:hypothetical protein